MAGQESDFAQENFAPKTDEVSVRDELGKNNGFGAASLDDVRPLDDYFGGRNSYNLPEVSFSDIPRLDEEGRGPLTRENARSAAQGWAASYDAAMNGDERARKGIEEIAAQWAKLPQDSKLRQYVSQILADMHAINPKAHAAFVAAMSKAK